jgi:hypothetical protein
MDDPDVPSTFTSNKVLWGPAIRRSTVPARPGVRKAVTDLTVETLEALRKDKFDRAPALVAGDVGNNEPQRQSPTKVGVTSRDQTGSTSTATVTGGGSRKLELDVEVSMDVDDVDNEVNNSLPATLDFDLKINNKMPITLLELKGSCKLNLDKCPEMKISEVWDNKSDRSGHNRQAGSSSSFSSSSSFGQLKE